MAETNDNKIANSCPPPGSHEALFFLFSRRLEVALDLLLTGPDLPPGLEEALRGSILLARRGEPEGTPG